MSLNNQRADKRKLGQQYETMAKQYLIRHGLSFIEANFNCKCGELDLIMRERNAIVFVEVKYRNQKNFGNAAEMVTYRKQQKLIKTAQWWLRNQKLSPYDTEFRFDVIAIHQKGEDINWIKNAITQG
ncbi:YraN family protein [Vibrio tapetis subsp. quintayensis]|uniref:YraN family protein n=1 Tax=Vibrio tapetis TaxID=52443 RepID=UPI0025B35F22|nr:YraN family protein [Vibrio tapetis]MDN3681558.1 YraN family protein [Vibrio tapetis subsp. quintayensis]